MRRPQDIIIKPVITEKSTGLMGENKYTFLVDPRANKIEIKYAIQELFKVKVEKVYTLKVRGKLRRQGRYEGKTPDRKKAIVQLKAGDTIEIFEGL
ncbi:MAG: 50S ribosomal protein L23 [Bacillota bacterium]